MLTKEQLADEFIVLFPDNKTDYDEHMTDYSELLGHVFFGEVINRPLSSLLKSNDDKETIQKYVRFIEHMFYHGDEDAKNIVLVTVLEYLGDDEDVLKNVYTYLSDDLIEVSVRIEKSLRRRDIIISHKNGKRIIRW